MAKSDGSSDGSQTSRKISLDISSSSFQTSNFFASSSTTEIIESEKENLVVPQFEEPEDVENRRPSSLSLSSSNSSSNGSSLENLTVAYSEDEKKRIKKYGIDNLNISNMQLENTLTSVDEMRVLSPRKTLYFHENSRFSVSLQDKVLQKPSEVERGSILMNISGNISATVEKDEANVIRESRKTIVNTDDMNLTLQNCSKPQKFSSISIPMKPSVFKVPKSPAKAAIPKAVTILSADDDTEFSSPPIKPPKLQDPRYTSEDFLDFMVSDTPTKNLCNNMCLSKKHKITPLQSPPPMKFARPPLDARDLQIMSQLGTADSANNSMDMLKTMGLEFAPASSQKQKPFNMSFDTSAMHVEAGSQKRKSIFTSENVDETLVDPRTDTRITSRQTLFEDSISIETPAEVLQVGDQQSRKTCYDAGMDMSKADSPAPQPQPSMFDLDDGTVVDTKAMTLVNIKSLVQPEQQRQSMVIEDASARYDDGDTPKGSYSVLMNISNATDISETTTELQAKANRLLQNPMATTASTSNLFTKSFQQDMDETGVSQKATPLQTSLPSRNRQRKTIYDTNMSLNISAATEQSHSTVNKTNLSKKSSLLLGSMISMEDVNISGIEPTQEILVRPRKTVFDDPMEEESFKAQDVVKKRACKPRETILGSHSMDTSSTETKAALTKGPSRMTTYKTEPVDETMLRDIPSPVETKGRITIYEDASIMEESVAGHEQKKIEEPRVLEAVKPRQTTFDVSMDEEKTKISPVAQRYLKLVNKSNEEPSHLHKTLPSDDSKTENLRKTFYETSMDEEHQIRNDSTASGLRQTTLNQDMDCPLIENTKKHRHTLFEASMDEEGSNSAASSFQSRSRKTLYKKDIDVEDQKRVLRSSKVRQTVYEAEMLEESRIAKAEQSLKQRLTIYDDAMEESTVTELEVPVARDAVANRSTPTASAIGRTFMDVAKQAGDDSERASMSAGALFPPPPGFQTPTLPGLPFVNFKATKIDESVSSAEVSQPMIKSPVDNTFVVKQRDDSRRLMNITDAEFSLLDDESDPCLQESETDHKQVRVSQASNTSLYHEALQEFVNITLKTTSSFSTNITGSDSEMPKAQDLDLSSSVDYVQKFEDQILNRKTMAIKQQPKMEIDVFLENLNIRPLSIPRLSQLPQLQPGHLERRLAKLAESSEKHRRKLADQRAKWDAQLPAIPSGAFLMKNYIEW